MKNITLKFYQNSILFFAFCFLLFFFCAPTRWIGIGIISIIASIFYFKKTNLQHILNFINTHPQKCFWIIVSLGFLLRLTIILIHVFSLNEPSPQLGLYEIPRGDGGALFQKIEYLLDGQWIQNKSWTSVVGYTIFAKFLGLKSTTFWIVNLLIYFAISTLFYKMMSNFFGAFSSVFLVAFYAFNLQIAYSIKLLSVEHFYFLFIALSLYSFTHFLFANNTRNAILSAIALSIFSWLAIWARSDGFIILIAMILTLTVTAILKERKQILYALPILLVTTSIFAVLSFTINFYSDGSKTIFCSNDNYIPRLIGVDFETKGQCTGSKAMESVMERFLLENPDKVEAVKNNKFQQPVSYINDILPYINDEIDKRRSEMTIQQWIELIFCKERVIFWNYTGGKTFKNYWISITYEIVRNLFITFCGAIIFISLLYRRDFFNESFIEMIWIYTAGAICMYALTEVNTRYSFLFYLLFAIIAAICTEKWLKPTKLDK